MLTDEQLMEQLKKGDVEALNELYRRYVKKLYTFSFSITHSIDPEDLVHDVFMRVIKAARQFNSKVASFRTWLFRIARNRCIDLIRYEGNIKTIPLEKEKGQHYSEEGRAVIDSLTDEHVNVEQSTLKAFVMEAVRECISELSNEEEKHAVVLYYIGEKVYREIGEMLGKSTSMAKNYVQSAQEKIKRCLERKGIGQSY